MYGVGILVLVALSIAYFVLRGNQTAQLFQEVCLKLSFRLSSTSIAHCQTAVSLVVM